ncbi:subtilisin-like protease Glyma18g48580 [Neltuma alba]|uniref:subtilisin-like protease Glyma18g48580 n=1 Tax=Neltuma alba TaxID=207710 RepID=UPI0010A5A0CB|nr:subtilisin-like protease Glyma18g48580 [Prosopis alba]
MGLNLQGSTMFHLLLSSFLICSLVHLQQPAYAIKKPYIVYLGSHSHGPKPSSADMDFATTSHYNFLASVLGSHERAKEAIFYSYNRHINGFAALLEDDEAAEIKKNPKVVSVFLSQSHKVHTTRSWEFLGQERNGRVRADSAWVKGRFGQNVIIGSLDTGVWPESRSFRDDGYGPIPRKWRGGSKCELYSPRNRTLCNRKLLGAKTFYKGYQIKHGSLDHTSARDFAGHGTHILSTAGGNFVRKVSVLNNGNGTAKGGSPRARLAVYKVCWGSHGSERCTDEDLIYAFDQAIDDGVDILCVSLGSATPLHIDDWSMGGISIGSFHAVARGIVVVVPAGNDGPKLQTVFSVEPWIFTVAAGSIDREFSSNITRSNGQRFKGTSLAPNSSSQRNPFAFMKNAKTIIPVRPAPRVSAFSARGPNMIFPSILKPDLTAPGQDIIAAYSPVASPTGLDSDEAHFDYNILSGTSMACAHVSGIAGLLKNHHPNWSPAMIKSAIMTTASILDNTFRQILDQQDGRVATPFHYGAGFVRPNLAMDPGLVYDLSPSDYLNFLCFSRYEGVLLQVFNYNRPYRCPRSYKLEDFNYPSITLPFLGMKPVNVTRMVTNVGPPSTYTVNVKAPRGVKVVVLPRTLTFQRTNQKKSYMVILQASSLAQTSDPSFGELTWTDGKHKVRSPIVIPQYEKMAI